jgi:hypothetical protein
MKISETRTIEELAAIVAVLKNLRSAFENGLARSERRSTLGAEFADMSKSWGFHVKSNWSES